MVTAKGEEVVKHRGNILKGEYLPTIRAFPGVRDLFERIKADGATTHRAQASFAGVGEGIQRDREYRGSGGYRDILGLLCGGFPAQALAGGRLRCYLLKPCRSPCALRGFTVE
jgi:hypothetical protein